MVHWPDLWIFWYITSRAQTFTFVVDRCGVGDSRVCGYARAGFDGQGSVYCAHAIKLDAPRGRAAEAVKRVSTKSFVQLELVYPSAAQSKAKEARPPAQAAFSTSLFIDTTTQSCPEVDLQNRMSKHSCTTMVVASCIFVSRLIAKSYHQEIQARSSKYKTGFLCQVQDFKVRLDG